MEKNKITFDIPKKIESGNKFMWAHWSKYNNYKIRWFEILALTVRKNKKRPRKMVHIRITSYRQRFLDDDNLRTGCKPIPDYLARNGWIVDDSPEHVSVEYMQERSKETKTIIELMEK